jgi:hypothetical protein
VAVGWFGELAFGVVGTCFGVAEVEITDLLGLDNHQPMQMASPIRKTRVAVLVTGFIALIHPDN